MYGFTPQRWPPNGPFSRGHPSTGNSGQSILIIQTACSLPGAYVVVHVILPAATRSVTVPANTLLFRREGLRVAVVRSGRAELVPVAIGRDYGASVEIVSGLRASDSIILDPSDSLENSAPVRLQARCGRSKRVQRSPFL
jgi:multidrug efflux pump subunit AcrA (membrane-fusion protein)